MALHPVNDRFKVQVDSDLYGFNGEDTKGSETGIVVEVPDMLIYLSFHSFAFERSFDSEKLDQIREYYNQFLGKRIYWESFQDRGRRIKEGNKEFVYLQMTDLLAYSDEVEEEAYAVEDSRSGSFKI